MTQEEKQLLLKDLCARLPYGVKVVDLDGQEFNVKGIDGEFPLVSEYNRFGNTYNTVGFGWKPYLRPMSSMTEEEKEEIAFIRDRDFQSVRKWVHDESIKETGNICPVSCGEIDYCNKKHLDYRGLIPMGLALEAPEGMYKTK